MDIEINSDKSHSPVSSAHDLMKVVAESSLNNYNYERLAANLQYESLLANPYYEPLANHHHGYNWSRLQCHYEALNNDMWEDIFPDSAGEHFEPEPQLQPKQIFDISLQKDSIKTHVIFTNYQRNDPSGVSLTPIDLAGRECMPKFIVDSSIYFIDFDTGKESRNSPESALSSTGLLYYPYYKFNDLALEDNVVITLNEALSKDKINSERELFVEFSNVNTNLKEIETRESGEGYEDYYECINENPALPTGQRGRCNTYTSASRRLPIPPVRIYDPLNKTTVVKDVTSCAGTPVRIRKVALIIAVFFVIAVIAVVVTIVVLNTSADETDARPTKPSERENRSSSPLNLTNPTLHGIAYVLGYISGITVLDRQLFVIRNYYPDVNVYDTDNLTLTRNITIIGSEILHSIVASSRYNCLYVTDIELHVVFRYNLSNRAITKWPVRVMCWGLSLTGTYNNIVLTLWNMTVQIQEHKPNGSIFRSLRLDKSIDHPWHSVQLSTDQFIVSHGYNQNNVSLHRVCIVDIRGAIIQCYGGSPGSGVGQLNGPIHMVVDKQENVLIADQDNNRVVVLSASLAHFGYVTIPGHRMSKPYVLHLDELNRRLYVAEDTTLGRVFALNI